MDELQNIAAENIGRLLGDYTKSTGTTKESVIRQLGCSKTAFYRKINGEVPFTMYEGFVLSKLLGCSCSDFFAMPTEA